MDANKWLSNPHPRASANIISALTFWLDILEKVPGFFLNTRIALRWTFRIFNKGYKRDLEVEDLYDPLEEHQSGKLGDVLEKCDFGKLIKHTFILSSLDIGIGRLRRKSAPER